MLFGVVVIAGLLFGIAFQQRHALHLRHALQGWLFLVIGFYFVWFWMRGQTLPMKTWRLRLVTADGLPLTLRHAVMRYLLAWLWFLPGLAVACAIQAQGWAVVALLLTNVLAWALTARLDPRGQFLHDRLAGTRVVGADGMR